MFICFDFEENVNNENTLRVNETTTPQTPQNQSQFENNLVVNSLSNFTTISPTTLQSLVLIANITNKSINIEENITCLEEQPSNIGSYEVPTQRDLVLFTKDLLMNLFETYKRDAMSLLRDIKEITKATKAIETKCKYNKTAYRQCVKLVSGQSETITKSLVTSVEMKALDIKDLTENTICSISEMKKDPISLIKLMVQEKTMLKFALPGFLRLLDSCSTHCDESHHKENTKKPLRRVTDQDLVVKYFLTTKE
ncbi:unnamed protein product [Euphydryas editha]|uniref:Uncharacterized protein n=1 Tax=Euphydryas editha TaxID=104508 RepID=A0AAU9UCY9_EUPED|nr:unnamed protein product [Euphydryas editha]